MMLDEHATHAQSHSSATQVDNFFGGDVSIASGSENSRVIFDGILLLYSVPSEGLFPKTISRAVKVRSNYNHPFLL
jgi:hypothetical protein